jgi:histidinol-phosphatase (PHP family)
MYWSNYHSHNTFCDGRSSMEDFVKFALAKGVKKYGFSSHAPLPFHTFWNMKLDDFVDYQAEYHRLKLKYNSKIELYLGLEVDYIHDFFEIQNNLFNTENFDYLIGSIHYTDRLPNGDFWTIDGDFEEFRKGLKVLFDGDIRAAARRFFEISGAMIQKGGFDIVGHFDKIALNGSRFKEFIISESWYKTMVADVLQQVKDKNLILEINTKSLLSKGITYPGIQFFPLINELQIPVVVSSDCHFPTTIIEGFEDTYRALKVAGFKTMQQLVNGAWQPVEFDEEGLHF